VSAGALGSVRRVTGEYAAAAHEAASAVLAQAAARRATERELALRADLGILLRELEQLANKSRTMSPHAHLATCQLLVCELRSILDKER